MGVNLPDNCDAGVVQLHKDASFTVTVRINILRFYWENREFEIRRVEGGFDACMSMRGREHIVYDLPRLIDVGKAAFGAFVAICASKCLSVPNVVERAEGGNTNSAFLLIRQWGPTWLKISRNRKPRYFTYLPDATNWIEVDGAESCDIMNSYLPVPDAGSP